MDTIEESTVAPESSSAPESVSSEAVSSETSSVSSESDSDSVESSGNEAPAPAYVPDFKLKVYDEEKEIDPMFRGLIKDADTEKKVKEFAQKAMAFDTVKTRQERTREEFANYQQNTKPVVEIYNQASNMLQKKDYDGIFDLLGIQTDEIFKYAVKKAEEAQLPESQRQAIHQQKQIEKERASLQTQNQSLQQQQFTQLSQFRAQELNWVMARPDVNPIAQTFDAKNGPGSFRQLVIDKGLAHYASTGGDLPAEQAVQEVMKLVGAFVQNTNGMGNQAPPQNQLIQQNGGQPPIIPNVSSRGSSPVKKQIRSLDDLKKRGAELRGSRQ